jgi:hypothetical protein
MRRQQKMITAIVTGRCDVDRGGRDAAPDHRLDRAQWC